LAFPPPSWSSLGCWCLARRPQSPPWCHLVFVVSFCCLSAPPCVGCGPLCCKKCWLGTPPRSFLNKMEIFRWGLFCSPRWTLKNKKKIPSSYRFIRRYREVV
jgi:hypothetical protein